MAFGELLRPEHRVTRTQYEADEPLPVTEDPTLPGPRRIEEVLQPPSDEPAVAETVCQLSFTTALARVSGRNPQVAFAAERYREAYARLEAARALWLPSIRAGVSYNKHEGRLQRSDGVVFDSSRASFQAGLGVQSVGTGSPAVAGLIAEFHVTDAIFQPRIANRVAAATEEASRATSHDVLLDTALAYIELLRAFQEQAIAEETLEHAQQLADLTTAFAQAGQGSEADADRAQAELAIRKNDVARAEEATKVATARLNELLSMEMTTVLVLEEPTVTPIELVGWDSPLGELLAIGLSNRPELATAQHLVGEAVHRYRREKYAPWLPSVLLGVSESGFGGSPGTGLDTFRDRLDLDLVAFWEIRNLGFGEGAARRQTRSQYDQARLRLVQMMDQVAREVSEAHAQVQSRHRQIDLAESAIRAATDSYRRNMERIRAGEGLPLETLQSIQALDQARREYLRAVVEHNEAQFRLHRALGWPIE